MDYAARVLAPARLNAGKHVADSDEVGHRFRTNAATDSD